MCLRGITVCCVLIPLLVLIVPNLMSNDPLAIVVPPQLKNIISNIGQGGNGGSNGNNNGNNSSGANVLLAQMGVDPNEVQLPQFENFTYDSSTQIATLTLNMTNPLTGTSLDVNSFNVNLSLSNGPSFTLQLDKQIIVSANQTGLLSLPISSSDPVQLQNLVDAVSAGGNQTFDVSSLQVNNLEANVNGVMVQVPNLSQLFGNSGNGTSNNSSGLGS